jgi:hypothetical protein
MKCVKEDSYVVEGSIDKPSPSWGEGFAGNSNRWNANDRCSGQGKFAVGREVGTLNNGDRCEAVVLYNVRKVHCVIGLNSPTPCSELLSIFLNCSVSYMFRHLECHSQGAYMYSLVFPSVGYNIRI